MKALLLAGLALGTLTTVATAGPLVPARIAGAPALGTDVPGGPTVLVGIRAAAVAAGGQDQAGTRPGGQSSGVEGQAGSYHSGGVNNGAGRAPAGGAHRGR